MLLLKNKAITHTQLFFHPFLAPGDYSNLTNFRLVPFNNSVRQLSFNVSIVNDNIPEDDEMVSTTLYLADRERIGNRVRVSPNVATVTIHDDDGKHFIALR